MVHSSDNRNGDDDDNGDDDEDEEEDVYTVRIHLLFIQFKSFLVD